MNNQKITSRKDEKLNKEKMLELAKYVLSKAKEKGASSSEVSLSFDENLTTTIRLEKVESIEFSKDNSISIVTYKGKRKGAVAVSELSKESINYALDKALTIAENTEEDECSGLADVEFLAKKEDIIDLKLNHPLEISTERAIEYAKESEKAAFDFDTRIFNSEGASFSKSSSFYIYANSNGFLGSFPSTSYYLSSVVLAKDEKTNSMQRDYDYTIARDFSDLENFQKVGENSAKKALKRLNARKIKTTKAPVLFLADVATGLFSNFISAISGGNLYRKSSFLLDSLNKKVFPEFINIIENPFIEKGICSACFDREGVATKKHNIVEKGIINSYVLSSYSARKLNMKTTGNAGGVHNLLVSNANENLNDLIKKMNKGLIVTELIGQGANIVTGNYSRGAFGFWVENGEIQYPVEEITIASNLKDMFLNIVSVANDLELRTNIKTGSVLLEEMTIAGC